MLHCFSSTFRAGEPRLTEQAGYRRERPVQGEVGDGLPAGLAASEVITAAEHLVRGDRVRVPGVLVVVLPLHRRRQDVIAAAGDEQQRRAVVAGEVIGGGGVVG